MEGEPAESGASAVGRLDAVGVLYQARVQIWAHTEQVRWALFYNYLVASSILLLGWAAVFASGPKLEYAQFIIMMVFSGVGATLSCAWWALGLRSSLFAQTQERLVRDFEGRFSDELCGSQESPFAAAQDLRERMGRPERWVTSKRVVAGVPLAFVGVYVVLLALSVSGFLGPGARTASPPPPLTSTITPTAIP